MKRKTGSGLFSSRVLCSWVSAGLVLGLAGVPAANAQVPPTFTYFGEIIKPDGTPLESSSVKLRIQIVSPGTEACVLYDEEHTLDMTGSDGRFDVAVGSGVTNFSGHQNPSLVLSMAQVFANSGGAKSGLTCPGGGTSYAPSASDTRKLKVQFYDGTQWIAVTPDHVMHSVPSAMVADTASKLEGKSAADFVQTGGQLTQTNLNSVFDTAAHVSELLALINGSSAQYAKASAATTFSSTVTFSSPPVSSAAPTTANELANKGYCDAKLAGKNIDSTSLGAIAAGDSIKWNGTSWISYTPSLSGAAGGDLSSSYPNPTVARIQGRAVDATAPSNGDVLKWNGTAWAPGSDNAGTGALPTLAAAEAGKFVRADDAGTTYILRTTADVRMDLGLGSAADNMDADMFIVTNAFSELTTAPVKTLARGNLGITTFGDTLVTASSAVMARSNLGASSVGDALFTAASPAVAQTALGLGSAATASTGTGSGNVPVLDGTGKLMPSTIPDLPAVSGANLLNLNANNITTGTLPAVRLPAAASGVAGIITTTAQTFDGNKTINGSMTVASDLLVDTSTLKVDSVSNAVGIGTSTPAFPLHVTSAGGTIAKFENSSAVNAGVQIQNSTAGAFLGIGATDGLLKIGATSALSPVAVAIDQAGASLAVGSNSFTTAAGAKLYVRNSSASSRALFEGTTGAELVLLNSGGVSGQKSFSVRTAGGQTLMRLLDDTSTTMTRDLLAFDHSNGNMGLGTTAPNAVLHMFRAGGNANQIIENTGGNAQMTLVGSGTSDLYMVDTSAVYASQVMQVTVDNGLTVFRGLSGDYSTVNHNFLSFNHTYGTVGIGTNAPSATATDKLTVAGDVRVGTTGTSGCLKNASGGAITGTCSSDIRFKKDIRPFAPTAERLAALQPVSYAWRKDEFPWKGFGDQRENGLIAQEVQKIFPELVSVDDDGYLRVHYSDLSMYMLQALKEHNGEIKRGEAQCRQVEERHERKIASLESEVQELKRKLQDQEERFSKEISVLRAAVEGLKAK